MSSWFLFQTGAIRRRFLRFLMLCPPVSIPNWCDQKNLILPRSCAVRVSIPNWCDQKGQGKYQKLRTVWCFYSKLVRLEVGNLFSIIRIFNEVSIPNWCDQKRLRNWYYNLQPVRFYSKLVRLEDISDPDPVLLGDRVSIPNWCDQKGTG